MPSDEQVVRRLAEMRGWTCRRVKYPNGDGLDIAVDGVYRLCWNGFSTTFNPLGSISDSHACMMALPEEKREVFVERLATAIWKRRTKWPAGTEILGLPTWLLLVATPRQISLAMYAALEGK